MAYEPDFTSDTPPDEERDPQELEQRRQPEEDTGATPVPPAGARMPPPVTVLSRRPAPEPMPVDDPTARHADVLATLESQRSQEWNRIHPFLPSGWQPEVQPREQAVAVARSDIQARQQELQRRAQIAAQAKADREATGALNDQREAQMRGTGQAYYRDSQGQLQPVLDPTGRPIFHETGWEEGQNPQGEPSLVKRDRYGQRQFKLPPLTGGGDPNDENMYFKYGSNGLTPAGMTIDQARTHPNPAIAAAGHRAYNQRHAQIWKEAIGKAEQLNAQVDENFNEAQRNFDGMGAQIEDLQTQIGALTADPHYGETVGGVFGIGGTPSENAASLRANAAQMQLKVDELTKARTELAGHLDRQTGDLVRQRAQAKLQLAVYKETAAYHNFANLEEERKAVLALQGKSPDGDPQIAAIRQQKQIHQDGAQRGSAMLQRFDAANQQQAQTQAPQQPGAAPAIPEALQNEPFALASQGVKGVGPMTVQRLGELYGTGLDENGQPSFHPDSLLRINQRIQDNEETQTKLAGQSIAKKAGALIASLDEERKYLKGLYASRLMRLPPDQQKRIQDYIDSQKTTGMGAFLREAGVNVGPAAVAAQFAHKGARIGATVGAMVPGAGETGVSEGIGALIGGGVAAIAGYMLADKVQREALKAAFPEQFDKLQDYAPKDWAQHPISQMMGRFVGQGAAPGMGFSTVSTARGVIAFARLAAGETLKPAEQFAAKALAMKTGVALAQSIGDPLVRGEKIDPMQVLSSAAMQLGLGGEGKGGEPGKGGAEPKPGVPPPGSPEAMEAAAEAARKTGAGTEPMPATPAATEAAKPGEQLIGGFGSLRNRPITPPPPEAQAAETSFPNDPVRQSLVRSGRPPTEVAEMSDEEARDAIQNRINEAGITDAERQVRQEAADKAFVEEERIRQSPAGGAKLNQQLAETEAQQQKRVDDFYKARQEEMAGRANELRTSLQNQQVPGGEAVGRTGDVQIGARSGYGPVADAAFDQLTALDVRNEPGQGATKERARLIKIIEDEKAKMLPPEEGTTGQPAVKIPPKPTGGSGRGAPVEIAPPKVIPPKKPGINPLAEAFVKSEAGEKALKEKAKTNAVPEQVPAKVDVRQPPSHGEGVGRENAVNQVAPGARQGEVPSAPEAPNRPVEAAPPVANEGEAYLAKAKVNDIKIYPKDEEVLRNNGPKNLLDPLKRYIDARVAKAKAPETPAVPPAGPPAASAPGSTPEPATKAEKPSPAQKAFNATAAGQKAMFYKAGDEVAAKNNEKMAQMQYDAGQKDAGDGKPARLPNIPEYMRGYKEGAQTPTPAVAKSATVAPPAAEATKAETPQRENLIERQQREDREGLERAQRVQAEETARQTESEKLASPVIEAIKAVTGDKDANGVATNRGGSVWAEVLGGKFTAKQLEAARSWVIRNRAGDSRLQREIEGARPKEETAAPPAATVTETPQGKVVGPTRAETLTVKKSFKDTQSELLSKIDEAMPKAHSVDEVREEAISAAIKDKSYPKGRRDKQQDFIAGKAAEIAKQKFGTVTLKSGNSSFTVANTKEALEAIRSRVERMPRKSNPNDPTFEPFALSQSTIIENYKDAQKRGANETELREIIDKMTDASLANLGLDKDYVRVKPGAVLTKEAAQELERLKAGGKPSKEIINASLESAYSRPMAVADVQPLVDAFREANPKAPKITVVDDPTLLENGRGVQGRFENGGVTINAAYAGDAENVSRILNHEWAHDTFSSPEGQGAIVKFAQREIPRAELDELAKKYPRQNGEGQVGHYLRLIEEWAAKNAETQPGIWQRIVERVKGWLADHGMATLTNEEAARAMLRTLREANGKDSTGESVGRFSLAENPRENVEMAKNRAPAGLAREAAERGNEIVYRMVRNPEEAEAIKKAVESGNYSAGFRAASVRDGHALSTKLPKIESAEKKGAIPIFTSPYPTVASLYKEGAGQLLAIEHAPEGVIYKSSRAGQTQSGAYSAQFPDAEHVIDARSVKRVYFVDEAQQANLAKHADFFRDQSVRGAFKGAYRDRDAALVAANLERSKNLEPPVGTLGRPFVEDPIKLANGLGVKKGDKVRFTGGATGVLRTVHDLTPAQAEQYHGGEPRMFGVSKATGQLPEAWEGQGQDSARMNQYGKNIEAVWDSANRRWIEANGKAGETGAKMSLAEQAEPTPELHPGGIHYRGDELPIHGLIDVTRGDKAGLSLTKNRGVAGSYGKNVSEHNVAPHKTLYLTREYTKEQLTALGIPNDIVNALPANPDGRDVLSAWARQQRKYGINPTSEGERTFLRQLGFKSESLSDQIFALDPSIIDQRGEIAKQQEAAQSRLNQAKARRQAANQKMDLFSKGPLIERLREAGYRFMNDGEGNLNLELGDKADYGFFRTVFDGPPGPLNQSFLDFPRTPEGKAQILARLEAERDAQQAKYDAAINSQLGKDLIAAKQLEEKHGKGAGGIYYGEYSDAIDAINQSMGTLGQLDHLMAATQENFGNPTSKSSLTEKPVSPFVAAYRKGMAAAKEAMKEGDTDAAAKAGVEAFKAAHPNADKYDLEAAEKGFRGELETKPSETTGIAQRVLEAKGTGIEPGEGMTPEETIKRGAELIAKGYDPEKAMDDFEKNPGKNISLDLVAAARKHEFDLQKEATDAYEKYGANSAEYKAAKAEDFKWQARIKPLATQASNVFKAYQGEQEIDTGTFHGLARAFHDATGREMTPEEAGAAEKIAKTVKGGQDAEGASTTKLTDKIKSDTEKSDAATKTAEAIVRAHERGEPWSPQQAKAIWQVVRGVYLDNGVKDFGEIRRGLADKFGLSINDVTEGMAANKALKVMTDDMYAKMSERRRLVNQAKEWLENAKYPGWLNIARKTPRFFFNMATFGHGTVGMITHAGNQMFDPTAMAPYWQNFGRQFKLMGWFDKGAYHEQKMADLVHDPLFITARRAGLANDPFRYQDDYQNAGVVETFKRLGLAGNRGFDALKLFRQQRFNQRWEALPPELKTLNMAKLLADLGNHESGVVQSKVGGSAANWFLFAPKLEASRWAFLIGDPAKATKTFINWANETPEARNAAIAQVKQKAMIAGTYLGALAVNQALLTATGNDKEKVNFSNPRRGDWLSFKVPGHNLGIISPMMGAVRFLVNVAHDAAGDRSKFEQVQGTRREEAIGHAGSYLQGKLAPFAKTVADSAFQADFRGRPMPWSNDKISAFAKKQGITTRYGYGEYAAENLLPIPLQEAIRETWKEQGMNEDQTNHYLNAIAVAAVTGGTGARLSEDLSGQQPLPTEANIRRMDPETALKTYENANKTERQSLRRMIGARILGSKLAPPQKRELLKKFAELTREQ